MTEKLGQRNLNRRTKMPTLTVSVKTYLQPRLMVSFMERHANECTTPLGTTSVNPLSDPRTARSNRTGRASLLYSGGDKMKRLRIASLNVGTMTSKSFEIEEMMKRRRIDILTVQETKWKNLGNRARFLDTKTRAFKMFYHGTTNGKNGVGIIVAEHLLNNIISISKTSDRLMSLKLVIDNERWNILSVYAPQIGCDEEEHEAFWLDYTTVINNIPDSEMIFSAGDMNVHIGKSNSSFESCHGGYGFGVRNDAGEKLLNLCQSKGWIVVNTMFEKQEEHLITYCSGGRTTQIDYHLCPKFMRRRIRDCKVIPGDPIAKQHRLLLTEFFVRPVKKTAKIKVPEKIRWKRLNSESGDKFISLMQEWLTDILNCSDDLSPQEMWDNVQEVCHIKATKMLGVTRGSRHIDHETWWWNEDTKKAVAAKKAAFQAWTLCRNGTVEEKQRLHAEYQACNKQTQKTVAQVKAAALKDLYDELEELGDKEIHRTSDAQELRQGSSFDNTKIYKIAASRRRNAKEIQSPRYIKDAAGNLLVKDKEICQRWREYCDELLNTEFPRESIPSAEPNLSDIPEDFTEEEVAQALKMMKNGKAVGPDDIPVEFWKSVGSVGIKFLTVMFNKMMRGAPMPDQWRTSYLIPLYKGKGDTTDCNNSRSIKLIPHSMKHYERTTGFRLRPLIRLSDNQCGFVQGKSTFDAIQSLRILIEKFREAMIDLFLIFIDLEKAFDRIPRDLIWTALRAQGISEVYVRMVQDMYDNSRTKIRCAAGISEEFNINVGVHQGGVLSPLLFNVTFDYLLKLQQQHQQDSTEQQTTDVWEYKFADDATLVSPNLEKLQASMDSWTNVLESNGLKISRTKTEFLHCNFSNTVADTVPQIKLGDTVLPQCEKFKYLGSMVNQEGTCEDDVSHRISVGWMKWKENSGVLCDPKMPPRLKGRYYTTVVRPSMTYGSQCWTMYAHFKNKMTAAEMKMCRMSLGVTKLDKIKSDRIRGTLHIKKSICAKIEDDAASWWQHIQRRPPENPVKQALEVNIIPNEAQPRRRGRRRNNWITQQQQRERVAMGNVRVTRSTTQRELANPTSLG